MPPQALSLTGLGTSSKPAKEPASHSWPHAPSSCSWYCVRGCPASSAACSTKPSAANSQVAPHAKAALLSGRAWHLCLHDAGRLERSTCPARPAHLHKPQRGQRTAHRLAALHALVAACLPALGHKGWHLHRYRGSRLRAAATVAPWSRAGAACVSARLPNCKSTCLSKADCADKQPGNPSKSSIDFCAAP